jgi:S-adenosylmethionine:tRNA ribosyltransferase-isomerase
MRTDDLDFHLPAELIAQVPAPTRSASRLLHYSRATRSITDRVFTDLPSLLRAGDLLVFNDARVTAARFHLRKATGGRVEALYLGLLSRSPHPPARQTWSVLLRNLGPASPGATYHLEADPTVTFILQPTPESSARQGMHILAVDTDEDPHHLLDRVGRMPLPPYIKRDKHSDPNDPLDRDRYQTVYSKAPGSVAAPTAGLHFTPELLAELPARGIQTTFLTLHVGLGTFKPVSADTLDDHAMHTEDYTLPESAAEALNAARRERRRIIAVGTTAARVLESQPEGEFIPRSASTAIFIYPPYSWKHTSALITNFHLPRSTLIALVAALLGLDEQRRLYAHAIAQRYRFFSYGDSSFLE